MNEIKSKSQIRAVTLWRPWAYAIAYLGKDFENRRWECYLNEGDYLAIHAGKTWDGAGAAWVEENFGFGILPKKQDHVHSAIVAVACFGGNHRQSASKWFVGPIGWRLYDVVPVEPVPVTGQRGLWKLDDETLTAVRQRYAKSLIDKAVAK